MRVLIVCSGNKGKINPFITEQVNALTKKGIAFDYFLIKGHGFTGYLSKLRALRKKLTENSYDLIHAHYGLSGLLAILQKKLPVVITFHGSDVMKGKVLFLSRLAAHRAAHNIVVEGSFGQRLRTRNYSTIPCGIDLTTFYEVNPIQARQLLGLSPDQPLVLFTSAFDNPVKNYPLAKEAIKCTKLQPGLVELKNYTRQEVNLLMNACNLLLMTSFSEGSPQVVKEAVACRLPVVSTPVGDVARLAEQIKGIHIVPYEANKIALAIDHVLEQGVRIKENELIQDYDNEKVADRIKTVYLSIIKNAS